MSARIIAPGRCGVVSRRGTLLIGWTLALLAAAGFASLGRWQAVGGNRAPPRVDVPTGARELRGLLSAPPSPGIRMGEALAAQGDIVLAVRLEPAEAAKALGLPHLAPRVLRLDPALPIGYTRDLQLFANTLTPDRHRGYAVQWYGLAVTTLVIALVLTFRRSRR